MSAGSSPGSPSWPCCQAVISTASAVTVRSRCGRLSGVATVRSTHPGASCLTCRRGGGMAVSAPVRRLADTGEIRVQGAALTAARSRLSRRVAGDGTRGAQPPGVSAAPPAARRDAGSTGRPRATLPLCAAQALYRLGHGASSTPAVSRLPPTSRSPRRIDRRHTHQGISVWEPTGRPGSATASTAMRGRVTGLSRNLQRSPDCTGGSECVPTRPVGNDAGAFAAYGRAGAAHPARRCTTAQSRWQQGRGAQTRDPRQPHHAAKAGSGGSPYRSTGAGARRTGLASHQLGRPGESRIMAGACQEHWRTTAGLPPSRRVATCHSGSHQRVADGGFPGSPDRFPRRAWAMAPMGW